jgi:UDP-2-acetamido-3-amino-2,3-dideoxy-glucuronate N-acetyltransferase
MTSDLTLRFPDVLFHNPFLTEVQDDVTIGAGSRVGSFTLIHKGARIGRNCTIGSHCNICRCQIGDNVSIQTGCHITNGVVIEDNVFIGPGVITLNDPLVPGKPLMAPAVRQGAKIGGGSILLPGVAVGRKVIVGSGGIVVKDVPDGQTVIGYSVRVLREICTDLEDPPEDEAT